MTEPSSLSRRRFLQTAGAGAATAVWIPKGVKGYTAAEMRSAATGGRVELGISKWELYTPALCVDLDKLERNMATLGTALARTGIDSRPHAKTHKCPAIAHMQMAQGAVGICTAKVSEAVAMHENGIEQILLTTINATPHKIRRAMELRTRCDGFIQAVDVAENARDLSDAATAASIVADVAIDVDPGGHRTGVPPGEPALELARLVDRLPGLRLRGLLCYDGGSQHVKGFDKRRAQTLGRLAAGADTCERMKRAGLNTEIFSGGGTGTYNIDHETPGLTDVQVGSYVFMDAQYLVIGGAEGDGERYTDFDPSLTILTTVLSAKFDGMATADAGAKSCTINEPDPVVVGETGISYRARSDEFGTIRYENPSRTYKLGDKLELIVPHCDPTVNLYDQMYAIRDDRVVAVWPITARGMSQ